MNTRKTKPSASRPSNFHASLMPLCAVYGTAFANDLAPVLEGIAADCRAICERHGVNLDELVTATLRRASGKVEGGAR